MKNSRYTPEFKAEALKQITERGHGVVEVSTGRCYKRGSTCLLRTMDYFLNLDKKLS